MFLFKEPITYTRSLIFGEKRITDVKLLVIGYNKKCTHSSVWLYKANKKVDWNGILIKEADYMNLIYDDNFLSRIPSLIVFWDALAWSKKENVTWEDLREVRIRIL